MDPEITHTPADAGPPRRRLLMGAGLAGAAGVAGALLRSTDANAQSTPPAGGVTVLGPPSGDMTGSIDNASITAALALGFPVLLSPGNWWITGLTLSTSGMKLWGSGCQMPGSPAPSNTYATLIRPGTSASASDPMIEVPTGVSEIEIRNLHLSAQIPSGGGNQTYCIYFPNATTLDNNESYLERISCENADKDGIYIGTKRAGVVLYLGWSFTHPNGAAVRCLGSNSSILTYIASASKYGFYIDGAVIYANNCQAFNNSLNGVYISSGGTFLYAMDINQNTESGLVVAGSATGVSVHGRFEGNANSSGSFYHIDASGAGTTAGTSGSLLGSNAGGVNILPGTIFSKNDFGTWKVLYDIYTAGRPALVNDWSTSDGDYSEAHID
jgi:hypothetical protein